MIKRTDLRDKGQGVKNLGECEQSPVKALESFVVYELGYGGFVTDLSPTKVTVETHIFGGTKDTTIFEGSREEMELIVKVAATHVAIMSDETSRNALIERAVDLLGTLPKEIGGLPIYIEMTTPLLIGGPSASVALLFGAGITNPETDPEVVKALLQIPLKDLMAAVELYWETGTPLLEIVREMKLTAA